MSKIVGKKQNCFSFKGVDHLTRLFRHTISHKVLDIIQQLVKKLKIAYGKFKNSREFVTYMERKAHWNSICRLSGNFCVSRLQGIYLKIEDCWGILLQPIIPFSFLPFSMDSGSIDFPVSARKLWGLLSNSRRAHQWNFLGLVWTANAVLIYICKYFGV